VTAFYRLENLIEFDDTYVGGKRAGKRGRGAEGKKPVLVAVETRTKGAGFVAMQAVDTVSKKSVADFLTFHLKSGQTVRTDALPALNSVAKNHVHEKKATPPNKTSEWLPLVHIMIGNTKRRLCRTQLPMGSAKRIHTKPRQNRRPYRCLSLSKEGQEKLQRKSAPFV
jgi:hypothetical protein